jgi:hypothetical protein
VHGPDQGRSIRRNGELVDERRRENGIKREAGGLRARLRRAENDHDGDNDDRRTAKGAAHEMGRGHGQPPHVDLAQLYGKRIDFLREARAARSAALDPGSAMPRPRTSATSGHEKSTMNLPSGAFRALAAGAIAGGAVAVGALAVGSVAIGRLLVRSGNVRRLHVDELSVGELRIERLIVSERSGEFKQ